MDLCLQRPFCISRKRNENMKKIVRRKYKGREVNLMRRKYARLAPDFLGFREIKS